MFYNEYTKKAYQGKNIEILKETGFTGGFLTFNQAFKLGGIIEKGTKCVAKLIKPHPEVKELPSGKLQEIVSGRKYPIFHISQVKFDKESA